MSKNRTKFAAKRLNYRIKKEHLRVQALEAANILLTNELIELKTADFNCIFHMHDQKRIGN